MSTRHAWAACLLLGLGLVPTVIHVYRGPPALVAGTLAARIPADLGTFGAKREGLRGARWIAENYGTGDYVSRAYSSRLGTRDIELFAASSYDWKKLFHFPEAGLAHGHAVTRTEHKVARGVPVTVLEFKTSASTRVAVYAFLYGDETIANPIGHVVREVPRLFVSARKRMTLLYAQTDGAPDRGAELEQELAELVAAAGNALRR
jgi:hypothetical protein